MKPGILMIDEGWALDYGDYDFCRRKFDDPAGMVEELHRMGFKVMLWMTPMISPDSDCYRELRGTNYLVHDKNGEAAVRKWWNGYSCVLDLSNPKACEWLDGKLEKLMKQYGVDGFKFDAGGSYLYCRNDATFIRQESCEHTAAFDRFAANYRYNELRCVWNCGGQPIVCRLQDKIPSWEHEYGITSLIPNMLIQGLLGYFFGCPDMIGGGAYSYFDKSGTGFDEELYLRWLAASALCPMMQFSISPKRLLSPEGFEIAGKLTGLHEKYAERILNLARNASLTGEPIIRLLEYEFPNQGFEHVTDIFMLGQDILVAPVLTKGARTRELRLPEGTWEYEGILYEGGRDVTIPAPLDSLPILVKQ